MMGHREILKGGDEYDVLTRARRFHDPAAGVIKKIKRRFWKRIRCALRNNLRQAHG